jgi:hypothetical protein
MVKVLAKLRSAVYVLGNRGWISSSRHPSSKETSDTVGWISIEYTNESHAAVKAHLASIQNSVFARMGFETTLIEEGIFHKRPVYNILACVISTFEPENIPRVVSPWQ